MKIYCAKKQFPKLQFIGTHKKPHGVGGLGNNYHMNFYPNLGHVTCEIRRIPCACPPCTYMINQTWVPGIPSNQKPHYQPIKDCTC